MFEFNNKLHDLTFKNNKLKSKLRQDMLKHGTFRLMHSRREMNLALEEYADNKSLIKSANNLGFDRYNLISAYIEGQIGNPEFRDFYVGINKINDENFEIAKDSKKDYTLVNDESSWIYSTVVDGEKISLISSDYERLCKKIKEMNLPFDVWLELND